MIQAITIIVKSKENKQLSYRSETALHGGLNVSRRYCTPNIVGARKLEALIFFYTVSKQRHGCVVNTIASVVHTFDRRTDGRTDRQMLIGRPRLHSWSAVKLNTQNPRSHQLSLYKIHLCCRIFHWIYYVTKRIKKDVYQANTLQSGKKNRTILKVCNSCT